MQKSKVSVIILTYNREDLVCKSLESVLEQSYQNIEIIIIDDGSEDDTLERLNNYNDSRIYIHSLEHTGQISKLRNYGLAQAQGEFISFLDSDDIWEKNHISNQVYIMENNIISGFVYSDFTVSQDNKIVQKNIYKEFINSNITESIFNELISGKITPIRPSTLLFRKKCLKITGLYNENLLAGDYNFLLKLAYHFKCNICSDPLVKIFRHANNISDNIQIEDFNEVLFTLIEFYKLNVISIRLYKDRSSFFYSKIFIKHLHNKKWIKAFKQIFKILKMHPFYILTKIINKIRH